MIRPPSIVRFDYFYLGAWAIGLVNTTTAFSRYQAMPQMQQANAMIGSWYLPTTIAVGLLIPLLLWYFVARRASVVAKWIVVVFAALALFGILTSLLMASYAGGVSLLLGIIACGLQVAAASLLFKPDAKAWFGEKIEDDIA